MRCARRHPGPERRREPVAILATGSRLRQREPAQRISAIIRSANSLVFTSVAPSIMRAKS